RLHVTQVNPAFLPMTLLIQPPSKQARDAPPDQLHPTLAIPGEAQGLGHLLPCSGYAPNLHKGTLVGVQQGDELARRSQQRPVFLRLRSILGIKVDVANGGLPLLTSRIRRKVHDGVGPGPSCNAQAEEGEKVLSL